MSMFNKGLNEKLDGIHELLVEVRGGRLGKDAELQGRINELRAQIATLEIEKSRKTESHEREKRETLHMVGLEKKRQEFEIESAKRETSLVVREENLAADKQRFADQMEFQNTRFEAEVGYLKDVLGQILDRLPTVTVDKTVRQTQKA